MAVCHRDSMTRTPRPHWQGGHGEPRPGGAVASQLSAAVCRSHGTPSYESGHGCPPSRRQTPPVLRVPAITGPIPSGRAQATPTDSDQACPGHPRSSKRHVSPQARVFSAAGGGSRREKGGGGPPAPTRVRVLRNAPGPVFLARISGAPCVIGHHQRLLRRRNRLPM